MILLQLLFAIFLLTNAKSTDGKSKTYRSCDLCDETCPDDKPCACRSGHSPCCLDCSLKVNCPSGCDCQLVEDGNEMYCNHTCYDTPTESPSGEEPEPAPSTEPTEPIACFECQPSDCTIENDRCGGYSQPENPCQSRMDVAKFQCAPSPFRDSCIWHVTCISSGETGSPSGSEENVTCDGACPEEGRPTICDAAYKLRGSDTNVTAECRNVSNSCQWIATNCIPNECKLNFTDGAFRCGTEILNCSIPLNVEPNTLCSMQSDGTCAWSFQCDTTGSSCQLGYDLATFGLSTKNPTPVCGNSTRPACGEGQSFSSKCGCGQAQAGGCEWVNVCEEAAQNQLCFLTKGDNLGWLCGGECVNPFCEDGSRFIPTSCESFNQSCVARGYCNRNTILSGQTSEGESVNTPGFKCNGEEKPTCASGNLQLIEPQCQCAENNGTVSCQWTNWLCQVPNPCGQCEYPCSDKQYLASGNCIAPAEAGGNCSWSGHKCADRPVVDACTCDDVAPKLCPLGQMRDNSSSPICVKSAGGCILQTACIADTCGGFSENKCTCDYINCIYISTNATDNDQNYYDTNYALGSSGMYEGCFSPNSGVLRGLLLLMQNKIDVLTTAPQDQCGSTTAPEPAPAGTSPAEGVPMEPLAPTLPVANASCENCQMIVNQIRQKSTNQIRLVYAYQVLDEEQLNNRQAIDNQTGACLGGQFELSVVAIGKPRIRQDNNSLDVPLVVYFRPLETVQQPTDEHKRVYCTVLNQFTLTLLEFDDNVDNTTLSNVSNCHWQAITPVDGQQGSTTNNNNYYVVTLNYPESLVLQALNGSNSSMVLPGESDPASSPTSGGPKKPTQPDDAPLKPPAASQVSVNISNTDDDNVSSSLAVNFGLLLMFIGAQVFTLF